MDTGALEIVDVLEGGNSDYLERFLKYRSDLTSAKTGERLIENYTEKRFDLSKQISVPVVFDAETGGIFGFSSVFKPDHWPEGAVRVGNRTWIDRSYRKGRGTTRMSRDEIISTTKTFIELVAGCHIKTLENLGIELAIITRESKGKNASVLPYLAQVINTEDKKWGIDSHGYYQTVPNGQSRDCWQKIIFTELRPGARRLLTRIPRITSDIYNRRFLDGPKF